MKPLIFAFLLFFSSMANATWVFPNKASDVQADRAALETRFVAIKADASTIVGFSAAGSGSLPCGTAFSVFGKPIEFCLDRYSGSFQSIVVVVLFIAALISIFIVIR